MDQSKDKIVQIVFARDYTSELEDIDTQTTPEDVALIRKAKAVYECLKTIPFVVNKRAADEFNKMVVACDKIAKEFSGRVEAIIDYEEHNAQITIECVHVEFVVDEFMDTLQEMAAKAQQVRFEPLISGLLRIDIYMPYFTWPYTEV